MARNFQDCVVLLGDSLTSRQDYPRSLSAQFSSVYRRSLDVQNRGFGGYNSNWVLPIMDRIFAKKEDADGCPKVRLVTVWLGTNDSVVPTPTERKDVPVEQFEKNINKIVQLLVDSSSPYAIAHDKHPLSIILITPPMFHEAMRPDPSNVTNERNRLYRQAVLRVGEDWKTRESGQRWKIGTIDYYGALEKARETGDSKRFYDDGVHLTTEGYDVLWEEIDRLVHTEFKGRGIDWDDQKDLPWTEPDWVELPRYDT